MDPEFPKEPSVLLEHDKTGNRLTSLRSIPQGHTSPAVALTAYDMEALRSGDLRRASQLASGVYKLTPVTA